MAKAAPSKLVSSPGAERGRAKPRYVAMMFAGLILAVVAIFMATLSLQMLATRLTHRQFVADELRVLHYDTSTNSRGIRSASGEVVSSGETFQIGNRSLLDLDAARELAGAGRLQGHVIAVRYLPPGSIASAFDYLVPFRVQSVEQFDLGFSWGLFIANAVFAVASVWLIRRAVHGVRHDRALA